MRAARLDAGRGGARGRSKDRAGGAAAESTDASTSAADSGEDALVLVVGPAAGAKGDPEEALAARGDAERAVPRAGGSSGGSGGSGGSDAEGAVEEDEANNRRNAAHCRKFREKRKRTLQELRDRNADLLADREEFERRIAELRAEVDVLRYAGGAAVDSQLENQLLRMEVERHRAFVRNVVRVGMQGRPAEVSVEESYRLLRTGVDATVGMMHGLLYTSVADVDDSWRDGAPVVLVNGSELRLRYQYVPAGSGPGTARRLNLRFDVPMIPAPARFVYEAIKHPYLNKDHMHHTRYGVVEDVLPSDVAELAASLQDPMRMYKYREAETEAEMVLVSSARRRTLFPSSLRAEDREELDAEGLDGSSSGEATLLVQCSTPSERLMQADVVSAHAGVGLTGGAGKADGPEDATRETLEFAAGPMARSSSTSIEAGTVQEAPNTQHQHQHQHQHQQPPSSSRYVEAPLLLGCALVPLGPYRTRMVLVESYPLRDEAFSAFHHYIFPEVDPSTHRVNKAYADDIAQVGNRFVRDVVGEGGPPPGLQGPPS